MAEMGGGGAPPPSAPPPPAAVKPDQRNWLQRASDRWHTATHPIDRGLWPGNGVVSDHQQWEDEEYLRNQQARTNWRDSKTWKSSESSKQSRESLEMPSSVIQQSQRLPPALSWVFHKPTKPPQYTTIRTSTQTTSKIRARVF